jgi:hypothetical protein
MTPSADIRRSHGLHRDQGAAFHEDAAGNEFGGSVRERLSEKRVGSGMPEPR